MQDGTFSYIFKPHDQFFVDNREKTLWEEKLKTREEMAKKCEESARRVELEHDQRVRDEVNK